ncbi:PREDICTED: uncharacterized protein LOC108779782 [Cyphomyrmex costatus]|uniref:uncharacterized protein LOC108779782 n=1 Tax=Cyphomyrmex costatus TaxID=456900 RepID=UPI0008523A0B|nr:PREDICTED: uncharacterized protein LOC108779782 [Cyphomyrmex costatus]
MHFHSKDFDKSSLVYVKLKADAVPHIPSEISTIEQESLSVMNTKRIREETFLVGIQPLLCNETITEGSVERSDIAVVGSSPLKESKFTAVSPSRIYNSPENVKLRKELKTTKEHYKKRLKVLSQKVRRMKKRMTTMEAIFKTLGEKRLLRAIVYFKRHILNIPFDPISKHKSACILDPCHMLKLVRNTL